MSSLKYIKGGRKYVLKEKHLYPKSIHGWGRIDVARAGNWHVQYGTLTAYPGYTWDGPSGPTRDDKTNIRASLYHDILYSACRRAIVKYGLKRNEWEFLRLQADKLFRDVLKKDGMGWFRRAYYYRAVRWFGEGAMLGEYKSKARAKLAKVCVPGLAEGVSVCAP